jgi:hypothetical protein
VVLVALIAASVIAASVIAASVIAASVIAASVIAASVVGVPAGRSVEPGRGGTVVAGGLVTGGLVTGGAVVELVPGARVGGTVVPAVVRSPIGVVAAGRAGTRLVEGATTVVDVAGDVPVGGTTVAAGAVVSVPATACRRSSVPSTE